MPITESIRLGQLNGVTAINQAMWCPAKSRMNVGDYLVSPYKMNCS
jgi:hypothetical protein